MARLTADSILSPEETPDFVRPPVIEVGLAAQLDSGMLGLLAIAEFARLVRADFPVVVQKPPLRRLIEDFEAAAIQEITVEAVDVPPMPRLWFVSEDERWLVQVQEDRLAVNWRLRTEDDEYPRYKKLRERFEVLASTWQGLLGDEALRCDWVEVLYANIVAPVSRASERDTLDNVLDFLNAPSSDFMPNPEDIHLTARFVIPDEANEPAGRLRVVAAPAIRRADGVPVQRLDLTARHRVADDGIDAVMRALDIGHDWIVGSFRDITSPAMHKRWMLRR